MPDQENQKHPTSPSCPVSQEQRRGVQKDPPLGKAGTWPLVPSLGAPHFILKATHFTCHTLKLPNHTLTLKYTTDVTKDPKGDRYPKL